MRSSPTPVTPRSHPSTGPTPVTPQSKRSLQCPIPQRWALRMVPKSSQNEPIRNDNHSKWGPVTPRSHPSTGHTPVTPHASKQASPQSRADPSTSSGNTPGSAPVTPRLHHSTGHIPVTPQSKRSLLCPIPQRWALEMVPKSSQNEPIPNDNRSRWGRKGLHKSDPTPCTYTLGFCQSQG